MNPPPSLVPTRIEDITPDWLSRFLQTRHPGVSVDDLNVIGKTQGGATRLRVRVRYAAGADAGLPEVLFIKTSLTRKMLVADPHMYVTEVHFYDRIRPKLDCETPAVYACQIDESTNRFALVIEDVSLRGARFPDALSALTGDDIMPLMSTLAALHSVHWGQPDLERRYPWLETATKGKTATWWTSESTQQGLQIELREDYKREAMALDRYPAERTFEALARVQAIADTGPQTVLHGDAHIQNTYHLHDSVGLLDWQLMRISTWAADVSYSIATALPIAERRANDERLLRFYLSELSARGVEAPTWGDAWLAYRQQQLYTVLAWAITPTAMYSTELLDAYIRRAVAACDDLDTYAAIGV